MKYPLISEYIESIKCAEDNLATLNNLRPVLDDNGNPIISSGNNAVVFKMTDGKSYYALKCFIRDGLDRANTYSLIDEELRYISSPFMIKTKYLEKELYVSSMNTDETEFSVVLMEWIEGDTLERYLRIHTNKEERYKLAYMFSEMALWLLSQPFAHGDIKPDNVIVRLGGKLALIDYDGMFVPAMCGQKPREFGTPGYRHPARPQSEFDKSIDFFSLVVIELSLLIIAEGTNELSSNMDEGLIFHEQDFYNIEQCEAYKYLLYHRSNNLISPIIDLFLKMLNEPNISKNELLRLKIPATILQNQCLYGQEALTFMGDALWRMSKYDIARDVQLNDGIFMIYSLNHANTVFFRTCLSDDKEHFDVVVTENGISAYTTLSIQSLKGLLLASKQWDEVVENRLLLL